ncbi:IPT/TIG domain-containing protein [Streptomyces sp. Rer75]|uniref:IPT/TIG domain-containing protein n=1 Tax=unclassified Streptomyces TaxID=2593676 RepID=UPI0015D071E7|nr:IPT/TIG domain-containing protein [Streptomyces sp. Rer75]QLH21384.1 IPT/TIG domain-containing protein [Streptomyces sp. Rer75]
MAAITSLVDTTTNTNQGKPGDTVQINGTALSTTTRVNFGATSVTPTGVTATQVTFVVPSTAPCSGQVSVSVSSNTGATSNSRPFFVIAAPTTTALSVTCLPAATGGAATLFGTNFLTGTQVGVGAVGSVAVTPTQTNQVTFTAPPNPGQVADVSTEPVTITTAGGTSASGTTLVDYYLTPAITTVAPATGTAGDDVTITGTSFIGVDTVTFTDSAAATATAVFTPISDTQLVATVPGGLAAGAGTITVTTCGGTSNAVAFTIT